MNVSAWDPDFAAASVWFAPLRALAARFAGFRDWPPVADLNARLGADAGVTFCAAAKGRPRRSVGRPLDVDALYEVRIARRREVPTRPRNWHDFLNALVWAGFPEAKLALTTRLGAEQVAQAGVHGWRLPNARTRVQDALALVDEGGAVMAGGGAVVFGHAVLEHLLAGRAPRVLCVPLALEPPVPLAAIDRALARRLGGAELERWPAVELAALSPLGAPG
jgi:hypothetical protein